MKLVNDYNHICNTETINLAPKNLHLSQSVLDKIKHYTIDGHLEAGQQYNFLIKEFS